MNFTHHPRRDLVDLDKITAADVMGGGVPYVARYSHQSIGLVPGPLLYSVQPTHHLPDKGFPVARTPMPKHKALTPMY